MRSLYSKDELFINAARKKPRWQAHIDNLSNLDDDSIMALDEPIWVREALKVLKKTDGKGQKQRKIEYQTKIDQQSDQQRHFELTSTFPVRTWSSVPSFIKGTTLDGSRTWEVEIKDDEPFLVKEHDVIVISGEFYRLNPTEMLRLMNQSKFLMDATLQEYFNYYRNDYLNNRY